MHAVQFVVPDADEDLHHPLRHGDIEDGAMEQAIHLIEPEAPHHDACRLPSRWTDAAEDEDVEFTAMVLSAVLHHQAGVLEDDDTELNIMQPAVYFVASEGRRSRRRPCRHALHPLMKPVPWMKTRSPL